MVSGHNMKVWLEMFFFVAWSQTAYVLCTEVHKRREKVRRRACRYLRYGILYIHTTSKVIVLFLCGCYESELCLRVIRGVLILPILLKNVFKRKKDKHT